MIVNNLWGDLTEISVKKESLAASGYVFKIKFNIFLDTLILDMLFLIIKIDDCWGDVTNI